MDDTMSELLTRIRGEYHEMPGLRLTSDQARRLWGLEPRLCETLLSTLVAGGFLAITKDGAYVWARSS
jgi:hypothetical protein